MHFSSDGDKNTESRKVSPIFEKRKMLNVNLTRSSTWDQRVYLIVISVGILLLLIPTLDYTLSTGEISKTVFIKIEQILIYFTGGRSHSERDYEHILMQHPD